MHLINAFDLLIVGLVLLLVYLIEAISGSTGLGRINNLEAEIERQQIESDTLLQRNQLIAADLQRIKTDGRQVEVLARYHLGMIKAGEVFVLTPN